MGCWIRALHPSVSPPGPPPVKSRQEDPLIAAPCVRRFHIPFDERAAVAKTTTTKKTKKDTAANIGFEEKLWEIADKLRGNLEPAVYKHDVLGLIFLKYISDRFMSHRAKLETVDGADLEDRDEYTADNVFWVPKGARWKDLQEQARQDTIGVTLDAAMTAVEKENDSLKGVLHKNYARLVAELALGVEVFKHGIPETKRAKTAAAF